MDFKRTVYVLPNLFTTANLFCGVYSIIATLNKNFYYAAVAILLANIFDIADGKVARITNTTSKFGIEYDSLCDLVSFGVAPGILIYCWALHPFGRFGWMASFLFIACGALRLARFNVMVEVAEKGRFIGLAIPAAASTIASMFLFLHYLGRVDQKNIIVLLATYILSFLMVSNIRYISFKELDFIKKKPLTFLFFIILLFILIASQPEIMIFLFLFFYVISGPIEYIFKLKIFRRRKDVRDNKNI